MNKIKGGVRAFHARTILTIARLEWRVGPGPCWSKVGKKSGRGVPMREAGVNMRCSTNVAWCGAVNVLVYKLRGARNGAL